MIAPDAVPAPATDERSSSGWRARLEVDVDRRGQRSVVVHRRHEGPLALQRALYPEPTGTPHLYLLHPPGGLVSGDDLEVELTVATAASALVTTPAATKIYRARAHARPAAQRVTLNVDGACEWLPGETIVFSGAHARLATRVTLGPAATFIGWEILCLGRPACGETLSAGSCELRLEVSRGARPLVLDRARLHAGEPVLTERWGLGGAAVSGTLVATADEIDDSVIAHLRSACSALPAGDLASTTRLDGAVVCRYLGASAERARRLFVALWHLLRPPTVGRAAIAPRIWAT